MSSHTNFFDRLFSSEVRRPLRVHLDASARRYLQDLQALPLLSEDEEAVLLRQAAQTDLEAQRRLVEANLRLVIRMALYFQGHGVPLSELIQEGNLGLLEAIRRFDEKKARRLSTYAKYWIAKYMREALRQQRHLIPLPAHTIEQIEQIEQHLLAFRAQGIEPGMEALARECHLPVEQVIALLEVRPAPLSLQRHQQASSPLSEILEAPAFLLSNGSGEVPALSPNVSRALGQLRPQEQQVLLLRFGLLDGVAYDDYHEVAHLVFNRRGKRVDERVRQIEKSAMKKLRVLLEASQKS